VWSKINSGSDNDNSSRSSEESEDSDSLSYANDEVENLFDSDWNIPDDMHWGNVWFQSAIDEFQLTLGPAINLPDSGRAIDFFIPWNYG